MIKRTNYSKPQVWLGAKRVCFECLQYGHFEARIVIMKNHKGFLCQACAENSSSFNVLRALGLYKLERLINQPWIGNIANELMLVSDSGFRGSSLDYFNVLKHRDKYNHLLLESVSIALEVLADQGHLSKSYETLLQIPEYFNSETQGRTKV